MVGWWQAYGGPLRDWLSHSYIARAGHLVGSRFQQQVLPLTGLHPLAAALYAAVPVGGRVTLLLSVCLSRSCIVSKQLNVFSIFLPSGSHTILVFPYQTLGQYSDGNPNAKGTKSGDFQHISRFISEKI